MTNIENEFPIPIESDFIEIASRKFHVVRAGPASGPVVFLLHGFPDFWFGWRKQIIALAQSGFRVVAPDLRGYNLSDKPEGVGAYRMSQLVRDVVGLIDAQGQGPVALVGHDWGGIVAWAVAARAPDRVRKLAIVNAPHPAVMRRHMLRHLTQLKKSWYVFAFQLRGLAEYALRRNRFERLALSLVGSSRQGTFSATDLERYREAWSQPEALTSMLNWYRAAIWYPTKYAAKDETLGDRVSPRTLVLWGEADSFLDSALAYKSAARCVDATVRVFAEGSHWLHLEEPEAVNQALIEFFEVSGATQRREQHTDLESPQADLR